jgi:hypothetical protein
MALSSLSRSVRSSLPCPCFFRSFRRCLSCCHRVPNRATVRRSFPILAPIGWKIDSPLATHSDSDSDLPISRPNALLQGE